MNFVLKYVSYIISRVFGLGIVQSTGHVQYYDLVKKDRDQISVDSHNICIHLANALAYNANLFLFLFVAINTSIAFCDSRK